VKEKGMTKIYDAIIIGAGHNGLTAALYLARGGWKTLVLERNERIGGAIRSGEVTLPGFIHDLYSTSQNLFLGSPVYQELRADLERHGLRYRTSSVEHLYMVGAATWPGAGTNATSGYLAAQLLLHPHALRNRVLAGSLLAGASGAGTAVAIQRLRALRTRK
jgi:phytoene dehydrogenase-like protein